VLSDVIDDYRGDEASLICGEELTLYPETEQSPSIKQAITSLQNRTLKGPAFAL
jgi:hypothetical protein